MNPCTELATKGDCIDNEPLLANTTGLSHTRKSIKFVTRHNVYMAINQLRRMTIKHRVTTSGTRYPPPASGCHQPSNYFDVSKNLVCQKIRLISRVFVFLVVMLIRVLIFYRPEKLESTTNVSSSSKKESVRNY